MYLVKRGPNRYLYKSLRKDGRIVRQYLGTGTKAELLYAEDQLRQQAARQRHASFQQSLDHAQPVRDAVTDFAAWSDLLTRIEMLLAGYHSHNRGPWRIRRGTSKRKTA